MRRYSKQYILVNGEKWHLISIKDEYSSRYEVLGFVRKSDKKDEFGYLPEGASDDYKDYFLRCPQKNNLPPMNMVWTPLPNIWLMVRDECKKCWGCHTTGRGEFNCILRSFQIKQYKDGRAMGLGL